MNGLTRRMFELHPPTRAVYPEFADVPLSLLGQNKDFLLQSSIAGSVLNLLIINLDDDQFVTNLLYKQTKPNQFVTYVDPLYQNDVINTKILCRYWYRYCGSNSSILVCRVIYNDCLKVKNSPGSCAGTSVSRRPNRIGVEKRVATSQSGFGRSLPMERHQSSSSRSGGQKSLRSRQLCLAYR